MSGIINFYEQPDVKKKMPKFNDEQFQYTGMKLRTRILLCGASGTGKSNSLINYIFLTSKPKKGTFKQIHLCYKTDEPLYEVLIEKLKDKITLYKEIKNIPNCQEFPDNTEDNILFIFDDCIADKDKLSVKKLSDYYAYSRKKGITLLFLTQSYFQTPKFYRDQMNYIILLSIKSSQDLNRIIKEYEIPDVDTNQINNMMKYCIKDSLNFMKIDTSHCSIKKKFSKNFISYLNPNDFKTNKYGGELEDNEVLLIKDKEESDNDSNSDSDSDEDNNYKRNEMKTLSEEANDKLKQRRHELNLLKAILNKNKKEN
jgi:hypothetical protein